MFWNFTGDEIGQDQNVKYRVNYQPGKTIDKTFKKRNIKG